MKNQNEEEPPRLIPTDRTTVRAITWDKSKEAKKLSFILGLASKLATDAGIPFLFLTIPKLEKENEPPGKIVSASLPEDPDGVVDVRSLFDPTSFSARVEIVANEGNVDGVPCAVPTRFVNAVRILEGRILQPIDRAEQSPLDELLMFLGIDPVDERLQFAREYTLNPTGRRRLTVAFPSPLSAMPKPFRDDPTSALLGEVFGPFVFRDEVSPESFGITGAISTGLRTIFATTENGASPSALSTILASGFLAIESTGDPLLPPLDEAAALSAFDPARILATEGGEDEA